MKTTENKVRTFDDIVFEHRNKQYGAYALRKEYAKNLLRALFTMGALAGFIIISFAFRHKEENIVPVIVPVEPLPADLVDDILASTPPPPAPKQAEKVAMHKEPELSPEGKAPEQPIKTPETPVGPVDQTGVKGPVTPNTPIGNAGGSGLDTTGSTTPIVKPTGPLTIAQVMPEFPGGQPALMKFLAKEAKKNPQWVDMGLSGTIYVSFVVNTDGSVSDVSAIRGDYTYLKTVAVNAVKAMPKWSPGMQNDNPARVQMVIPIQFKNN